MSLVIVFLAAGLAAGLWHLRLRRRERTGRLEREAGLAFTIDLVSVVVGSGGTIRQAVVTVAEAGPVPVRSAFGSVLDRSAGGVLLSDALTAASDDLGAAFHPLVGALVATERDGVPISMLLSRLADDADQARRWQTEAMVKRLPVSLLVPLVVCMLPAVVIGALVPLVIIAVRQLQL